MQSKLTSFFIRTDHPTAIEEETPPSSKFAKLSSSASTSSKVDLQGSIVDNPHFLRRERERKTQLFLDIGQKDFSAKTCKLCGMVYSPGNGTDEDLHRSFHQKFLSSHRLAPKKDERVLLDNSDHLIIGIYGKDPNSSQKRRADELLVAVDGEMGIDISQSILKPHQKLFVAVEKKRRQICGVLLAEPISVGFRRIIPDNPRVIQENSSIVGISESTEHCECSSDAVEAVCGVNRIWVDKEWRRKGIGKMMLDCVRMNFFYGGCIAKSQLAFSQPTSCGISLAESYFSSKSFLVYKTD